MTFGLIAAVDVGWVIGVDGRIPWHFKADAQRFKRLTMGSTCIMGKATWESLPAPLPGRRLIVLTKQARCANDLGVPSRHPSGSCVYCPTWDTALLAAIANPGGPEPNNGGTGDIWVIGGESIYREALSMPELEVLDLTFVPLAVVEEALLPGVKVARFPHVPPGVWELASEDTNPEDCLLVHRRYQRKTP